MIMHDTVKSIRVYSEGGYFKLDIRVHPNIRLPAKYSNNRIRCSTGLKDTAINRKYIDKNKVELAVKYLEPLLVSTTVDKNTLVADIALDALAEGAYKRRKQDGTKDYLQIWENIVCPVFGHMRVDEVKPYLIKRFQAAQSERKISYSRYKKIHYVLNRILKFATENGYIDINPIDKIDRNSVKFTEGRSHDNDYFTEKERERILNAPFEGGSEQKRLRHEFLITFLYVAFFSGARTGEVMALKWKDINFIDNTITISRSIRKGVESSTKTGRIRIVPMLDRLVDALEKWRQVSQGEYVFPVPNKGTPYRESRAIADHMYKPLLKRLGIPYKILYCTRSTFASLAVENGARIPTVSQCLGHRHISTTERYYIRMGNLDLEASRMELQRMA